MKNTKLTLLSTFFAATLCTVPTIQANEKGEAAHDSAMSRSPEMHINPTEGLKNMHAQLDSADKYLAAGKLDRMHVFAEAIEGAVVGIDKDTSLDAMKQKRVSGCVKNIAKLAKELDENGDANKLEETRKTIKKLKAQAELLEKQFKSKAGKEDHHK